jgi:hypothetical protein
MCQVNKGTMAFSAALADRFNQIETKSDSIFKLAPKTCSQ